MFTVDYFYLCLHGAWCPFIRGRDFCWAETVTFSNSLNRSERHLASFQWQLMTTNVSRQTASLPTAPGEGWRWGPRTPRRQRFIPTSLSVSHTHTHMHTPATKPLTYDAPRDWINLLWEAGSDAVCLEADWYSSQWNRQSVDIGWGWRVLFFLGGGSSDSAKPSFHLFHPHFYSQGQSPVGTLLYTY